MRQISKTKSNNQFDSFADSNIFLNKLPNQIKKKKNGNSIKKFNIKLDDLRKKW